MSAPEQNRAALVACPEHDPHPQRDGTVWCPNCPTGLGASDGTSKSQAALVALKQALIRAGYNAEQAYHIAAIVEGWLQS